MDVDLAVTGDADDHLEQAARHRGDTEDGDPLGQSRFGVGALRTEALESVSDLLGLGHSESGDERPPEIGLPDLVGRERLAVGGDVATLGPSGKHRRPIHLVAVEQIGDRAGSNDIVEAIGEPERSDRPGESIDGPVTAEVVAERTGGQRRRKGEVDVRGDAEPLGQTLSQPVADPGCGNDDEFWSEWVRQRHPKPIGEPVDEIVEPLADPQQSSHRSDSTHGV